MEQRQMRLKYDRILDFKPLFLFFNMFNHQCFQDASAWVTEALVLKV